MRPILMAILLSFGFISCTSNNQPPPVVGGVICSLETAVTSAMSAAIATNLTCSNLPAIQGDIMNVLGKANFCTQVAPDLASVQAKAKMKAMGPVGNLVCPLAIDAALGLVTSKIPTAWGCSPSATVDGLSQLLTSACEKAVGI